MFVPRFLCVYDIIIPLNTICQLKHANGLQQGRFGAFETQKNDAPMSADIMKKRKNSNGSRLIRACSVAVSDPDLLRGHNSKGQIFGCCFRSVLQKTIFRFCNGSVAETMRRLGGFPFGRQGRALRLLHLKGGQVSVNPHSSRFCRYCAAENPLVANGQNKGRWSHQQKLRDWFFDADSVGFCRWKSNHKNHEGSSMGLASLTRRKKKV